MGEAIDRSGKDCMGYDLVKQLDGFTDDDIRAAQALAKAADYRWDCVMEDPAVTGKRFLQSAKIVRESLASSFPPQPTAGAGRNKAIGRSASPVNRWARDMLASLRRRGPNA